VEIRPPMAGLFWTRTTTIASKTDNVRPKAERNRNRHARVAEAERRARYWMNHRSLRLQLAKLSNWVGKITADDVKFLRTAPLANEAIADLHRLSGELRDLAWKLSTKDDEQAA
jgi:hypothetical protein